jgi:hypothetical protein
MAFHSAVLLDLSKSEYSMDLLWEAPEKYVKPFEERGENSFENSFHSEDEPEFKRDSPLVDYLKRILTIREKV